ncbi:hypothetical protein EQV77_04450 [Halobacillus fulvus]|nr:hypothetical protein EQV77_04450 [Halobacillus fulvus]
MLSNWTHPLFWLFVYVIHGLLVFVVYKLLKSKMREEEGILTTIVLVSLFLPFLGEILGAFVWGLSKRLGHHSVLDDYEEYVTFKPLNLEQIRYEARSSMELVPISEAFSDEENSQRKDLILRLVQSRVRNKGKYLNLGLENDDSETVHYAATTKNFLIDQYEKERQKMRREFESGNLESLEHVINAYSETIHSGLLEGASLDRLLKEYIQFLEKEKQSGPPVPKLYLCLGDAYFMRSQAEEGLMTLHEYNHHFPYQAEGYLRLLTFYYDQNDWNAIRDVLKQMEQFVARENVPDNQRFIIEQIGGVR